MKITKRPVAVDAVQFVDEPKALRDAVKLLGRDLVVTYRRQAEGGVVLEGGSWETGVGVETVAVGEWIVRAESGVCSAMPDEVLRTMYDVEKAVEAAAAEAAAVEAAAAAAEEPQP